MYKVSSGMYNFSCGMGSFLCSTDKEFFTIKKDINTRIFYVSRICYMFRDMTKMKYAIVEQKI